MPARKMMDAERFWPKVDTSDAVGCWPWLGAKSDRGYGMFYLEGKQCRAHHQRHQSLGSRFRPRRQGSPPVMLIFVGDNTTADVQ